LKRLAALIFIVLFVATISSPLIAHATTFVSHVNRQSHHHYKWVFMVYMDGDNNLEGAAISDFNEMEMAGSTVQVAIVVMFDRIPGYDSSNGNWTDTRIYLVKHDTDPHKINSELLADLGELDMGDPHTLVYFVNFTVHHFPADHYALVLWDHGNAWKRARTGGINVKGVCWDETNGWDYLTEQELIEAMKNITEFTHIDLIGFDVCLLGMVEVAYDLAPYAKVFVASQEYEPLDGWYYTPFLQALDADPNMTPQQLGAEIVKAYKLYYTKISPDSTVTLAAIDLKEFVSDFIPKLNYASLLMTYNVFFKPNLSYKIKAIRDQTEFTGDGEYVDVYDLLYRLNFTNFWMSDYDPRPLISQALAAYNKSVIAYYAGSMHPHAHGLSIYFPPDVDTYLKYRYWYFEQTNFANDLFWSLFLDYYFYTFKPSLSFKVKINVPSFVTPGESSYALVETSYGGKRVDPDSLSVSLLATNGTKVPLDTKKIDVGLYLVKLPPNLTDSAFITAEAYYWFLQATDSQALKVENVTATINNKFSALRDLILSEINSVNTKLNYISNGVVEIKTALGNLTGKVVEIGNGVATLRTELGDINVSLTKLLESINAKIVKLDNDVAIINSTLGTISVKLSDLNTSITYIGNGVVEIKTALGNLQGVITSVKGDTATIKTNLGTVQTTLSSITVKLDQVKDLASLIPTISSQQKSLAEKSEEIESTQRTVQGLSVAILVFVLIGLGVASLAYGRKMFS